jgi:hypothetical protein
MDIHFSESGKKRVNNFCTLIIENKTKFSRDNTYDKKIYNNKINFDTIFLGESAEYHLRQRFLSKDSRTDRITGYQNKLLNNEFFSNYNSICREEEKKFVKLNKYGLFTKKLNKFKVNDSDELKIEPPQDKSNKHIPSFKYFYKTQAGKTEDGFKKINQDSYLELLNIFDLENFHMFAILDGHGKI